MRFLSRLLIVFAAAAAMPAGALPPPDERAAKQVAAKVAYLYAAGDASPGWDRGGVDILRLLASAPGGSANNAVIHVDQEDGKVIATLYDAAFDRKMIPANWSLIKSRGTMTGPASGTMLSIARLDGPYVLLLSSPYARKGGALCTDAMGDYQLYRVPGLAAGLLPQQAMLISMRATEIATAGKQICEVHRQRTGYLAAESFTPDGRQLPGLKEAIEGKISIVPRRPLAKLIEL